MSTAIFPRALKASAEIELTSWEFVYTLELAGRLAKATGGAVIVDTIEEPVQE
jgi:hypothetical protein